MLLISKPKSRKTKLGCHQQVARVEATVCPGQVVSFERRRAHNRTLALPPPLRGINLQTTTAMATCCRREPRDSATALHLRGFSFLALCFCLALAANVQVIMMVTCSAGGLPLNTKARLRVALLSLRPAARSGGAGWPYCAPCAGSKLLFRLSPVRATYFSFFLAPRNSPRRRRHPPNGQRAKRKLTRRLGRHFCLTNNRCRRWQLRHFAALI